MKCKNCNSSIDGNFCAQCGQSTKVGKINFAGFIDDLSTSIFQVDKGFFYTLKELFLRPGHSIRDYLNGKRKRHFKPIAYVLTLSTIYFLLSQFTDSGTIISDFLHGFTAKDDNQIKMDSNSTSFISWFAKNYAYATLLILPIFVLTTFIAFLDLGYNYLEHFVLNAYITGQQSIFYLISSMLGLFIDRNSIWASIPAYISILFVFYTFIQFFHKEKKLLVILRMIGAYILFMIIITPILIFILSFSN